jgi:chemotaxis signal transduction protein
MGENKMITGVRLPTCRGQLFGAVDLGECIYHEETVLWEKLKKVVLLNAVVTRSDKPTLMVTMPATVDEVKSLIRVAERIESYIGHESTARMLSTLLGVEVGVSRAMYMPERGDIAVVVRLKKRLEKPEDVKNVRAEDVEFLIVNYYIA